MSEVKTQPSEIAMKAAREQFKQYRRTQIAEMADWEQGFDMLNVSVSAADASNGSPKLGDKIARNPANHEDRWLVAKVYFDANFEVLGQAALDSSGIEDYASDCDWPKGS